MAQRGREQPDRRNQPVLIPLPRHSSPVLHSILMLIVTPPRNPEHSSI